MRRAGRIKRERERGKERVDKTEEVREEERKRGGEVEEEGGREAWENPCAGC